MIDGDDSGDGDSDGGESDSSAAAVNGRSFDFVTHGRYGRFLFFTDAVIFHRL